MLFPARYIPPVGLADIPLQEGDGREFNDTYFSNGKIY